METWKGWFRGLGTYCAGRREGRGLGGLGEAQAGVGVASYSRGRVDGVGLHSPPSSMDTSPVGPPSVNFTYSRDLGSPLSSLTPLTPYCGPEPSGLRLLMATSYLAVPPALRYYTSPP